MPEPIAMNPHARVFPDAHPDVPRNPPHRVLNPWSEHTPASQLIRSIHALEQPDRVGVKGLADDHLEPVTSWKAREFERWYDRPILP